MGFLRGKGHAAGRFVFERAFACVILSLGTGGWASAQRPQRRVVLEGHGVERAFAGPRTMGELRQRLASVDDAEIPRLFQVAVDGCLHCEKNGEVNRESVPLSAEERRLVRESLAARPRRSLVPFLEELAAQPLIVPMRLEALALLGNVGSGDHMKLLARLTVPFGERTALAPELRSGFSAALGAILLRDSSAIDQIPELFSESPPGLTGSIVEALARVPSCAATHCLALLLGRSPGLDPLLLARLSERAEKRVVNDEFVLDAVRRYLRQREPGIVRAAAHACGELDDDAAVEPLIELMEHEDVSVRCSAFAALEKISGLSFGADARRWTSWYNSETRWWEEESESLLVRIERGRGVEFVRAAGLVLEHRLFRDRVAESFALALRHDSADEVRLACRALGQLRSPVAVRALIECLDHDDSEVRALAWKALRAITGVDLPPEADSWAALSGPAARAGI